MNCNQCTTAVEKADNGGGYACVGAEGVWQSSLCAPQFFCEPETAQKKTLKHETETSSHKKGFIV